MGPDNPPTTPFFIHYPDGARQTHHLLAYFRGELPEKPGTATGWLYSLGKGRTVSCTAFFIWLVHTARMLGFLAIAHDSLHLF